jgi:hypothetical protein
VLAGAGLVAGADRSGAPAPSATPQGQPPPLGLMGTIPLYWGEAEGLGDIIDGEAEPHWARARLEQYYRLHPLAALTEEALSGLDFLLLAQPRALSPAENVALDTWVRGGGRLLLFADPLLTGESRFGIGDRRRPQDVILLSPILGRWGLALEFVEDQSAGPKLREIAGQAVPVNLPGRFAPAVQAGCTMESGGLLADCAIGKGRVVVLADAALLDLHHPAPEAAPALTMLVARAFAARDFAGKAPQGLENGLQAIAKAHERHAIGSPAGSIQKLETSVRSPP